MRTFLPALLLPLLLAPCVSSNLPEQVHIAFGTSPDSITVSWATPYPTTSSLVHYGKTSSASASASATAPLPLTATGKAEKFEQLLNDTTTSKNPIRHIKCPHCITEYLHSAVLAGLTSGARYAYQIDGSPDRFSFVAKNNSAAWAPTFAVYGDMGTYVRQPDGDHNVASPSLARLREDVATGSVDGILHVGDFAYDFMTGGGTTAQTFFRQIQSVAASVPYMTVLGNHEAGTNFAGDLHHYVKRFDMPNKAETSNVYYSFDVGPAHIVAFSSEVYFWQLWDVEAQFAWLKKDLAAVDRIKTPFVITMAHRPMYCSNDDGDDCTKDDSNMRKGLPVFGARLFALEALFRENRVDLAFWAHEHSYERCWPVYDGAVMNGTTDASNPYHNPKATVHIVTGAAGGHEGHDPLRAPRGPWSAVRGSSFGYGKLFLANRTHLQWRQFEDTNHTEIDSLWLIKDGTAEGAGPRRLGNEETIEEQKERKERHRQRQEEEQAAIFERTKGCLAKEDRLPHCAH